jgi:hypothetical protein
MPLKIGCKQVQQGSSLHLNFSTFSDKENYGTACAENIDWIK